MRTDEPTTFLTAIQLSLRVAVAAGLAVAVAQWLSLLFPLPAMVAAIIVTDLAAHCGLSQGNFFI